MENYFYGWPSERQKSETGLPREAKEHRKNQIPKFWHVSVTLITTNHKTCDIQKELITSQDVDVKV